MVAVVSLADAVPKAAHLVLSALCGWVGRQACVGVWVKVNISVLVMRAGLTLRTSVLQPDLCTECSPMFERLGPPIAFSLDAVFTIC